MDNSQKGAAAPGSPATAEAHKSLSHRIAGFIHRFRLPLFIAGGAVAVAVIGLGAFTAIQSAGRQAASVALHELLATADTWSAETDSAKKAEFEKSLISDIDSLVAKHAKTVYAQQALDIKATLASAKEDWAEAEKSWAAAIEQAPGSFLAPFYLQNAAMAAEEVGANDRAVARYKELVEKHATTPGVAHAWFALGRLAEESKAWAEAVTDYEKIVASWPNSDWTKLAKDRILSIKSRGLVQ